MHFYVKFISVVSPTWIQVCRTLSTVEWQMGEFLLPTPEELLKERNILRRKVAVLEQQLNTAAVGCESLLAVFNENEQQQQQPPPPNYQGDAVNFC